MKLAEGQVGGLEFKPTAEQVNESENKTIECIVV
jgi:hypothetical protein